MVDRPNGGVYGTGMKPSQRPGQIRFEAWVPETLYREFAATGVNRAAWLRRKMIEYVENADVPVPPPLDDDQ